MSEVSLPLIGLSTYLDPIQHGRRNREAAFVPATYVRALTRAGGAPVLIPPAASARSVLSRLDGLVLTGGSDVNPARYGAPAGPETQPPRDERDGWELDLCRGALERDLPLLAICRGMQILNVGLGGSLHQHLPDLPGVGSHQGEEGRRHRQMDLEAGSMIAGILGDTAPGVCRHHQAVDRLGRGLSPTGHSDDGLVEAIEVRGRRFAIGVQWHPEENPDDDRLFEALVATAAAAVADR